MGLTHWKIRRVIGEVECASLCNNSSPDYCSCLEFRLEDTKVHQIILQSLKIFRTGNASLMPWYLFCKLPYFHITGLTADRRWFDIRWLYHVIKSLILSVIFLVWSSCIISYLLPDYSMLNKWVYGRYFRMDVNILATYALVSIVLYNKILKQGRTSYNSSIGLPWWLKTRGLCW